MVAPTSTAILKILAMYSAHLPRYIRLNSRTSIFSPPPSEMQMIDSQHYIGKLQLHGERLSYRDTCMQLRDDKLCIDIYRSSSD